MMDRTRRNFLKTSAGAAGLFAVGSSMTARAWSIEGPETPAGRLEAFPLTSVRLGNGIFRNQEDINARYLDSLSADRLLHSFRVTAGLSSGATPYGGWEEPACELRGHFAGGHVLSAFALASATSGNDTFKARVRLVRAAWAVRTLALVAIFIPIKPARAEKTAPIMKANAIVQ